MNSRAKTRRWFMPAVLQRNDPDLFLGNPSAA
jgi:hypothetical protein